MAIKTNINLIWNDKKWRWETENGTIIGGLLWRLKIKFLMGMGMMFSKINKKI